jgi:hypothetical protein
MPIHFYVNQANHQKAVGGIACQNTNKSLRKGRPKGYTYFSGQVNVDFFLPVAVIVFAEQLILQRLSLPPLRRRGPKPWRVIRCAPSPKLSLRGL